MGWGIYILNIKFLCLLEFCQYAAKCSEKAVFLDLFGFFCTWLLEKWQHWREILNGLTGVNVLSTYQILSLFVIWKFVNMLQNAVKMRVFFTFLEFLKSGSHKNDSIDAKFKKD